MELDELKTAWTELDNRLKKNEELKESIILEMMTGKAGKLVNKVLSLEIRATIIATLVMLFCIYWLLQNVNKFLQLDIMMIFVITVCFFHFSWGLYKIYGLTKIDTSKNVGNTFYYVNRYSIQLKREKKIYTYFLVAHFAFSILMVAYTSAIKVKGTLPPWSFFIWILPIMYWWYVLCTPNSHKNIGSILKSLDEIRELKEE